MSRNHLSMSDYADVRLRGQDMPLSKLTDLDVIDIRSRNRQRLSLEKHIAENLAQVYVAKLYGITLTTLQGIQTYKTWRHLP